ncbi:MAG: hypothetical protein IKD72_01825 [Clostridia bacterium]|nr:hypothetical protein [Clostridia bacterium]
MDLPRCVQFQKSPYVLYGHFFNFTQTPPRKDLQIHSATAILLRKAHTFSFAVSEISTFVGNVFFRILGQIGIFAGFSERKVSKDAGLLSKAANNFGVETRCGRKCVISSNGKAARII